MFQRAVPTSIESWVITLRMFFVLQKWCIIHMPLFVVASVIEKSLVPLWTPSALFSAKYLCFTAHVHPHENPNIQLYFWSRPRRAQEVLWGSPAGRRKNVLWVQKCCQLHPNMRRQPHSGWERLTVNKHRLFIRSFVSAHQLTCTAWKERFYLII